METFKNLKGGVNNIGTYGINFSPLILKSTNQISTLVTGLRM